MADKNPPKMRADHVSKRYAQSTKRSPDTTTVLEDFSLEVADNEFVTVLGPSGCGKTTLLNLFAGLEAPTGGQLYVDGKRIDGPSPDRGVIFQQYALFPWQTVLENVSFGLRLRGVSKLERERIAQHYLESVGLKGFETSLPKQLSGGMKQRCAIARAYAAQPSVLLMDEPFGALDAMTKMQLQGELLRTWQEDKRTVLFITHDIDEAIFLGSRIVVLSERPGTIVYDEPTSLRYPRDSNVRFEAEFQDIRRELWSTLHGARSDIPMFGPTS